MLPKVDFNKTAFVKFKISNNIKQSIGETDWKQPQIHRKNPYQPMGFKNLKKKKIHEAKVSRLSPNFVISNKKLHKLGFGFKNL